MSYQLLLPSNSQMLKVCCTLVATQKVAHLGTQLRFLVFLHFGDLLLSTQPEYHELTACLLSNSQRLKVCCTLVSTWKVAYLSTQLIIWYFCTLEISLCSTQPEYHELSGWSPEYLIKARCLLTVHVVTTLGWVWLSGCSQRLSVVTVCQGDSYGNRETLVETVT